MGEKKRGRALGVRSKKRPFYGGVPCGVRACALSGNGLEIEACGGCAHGSAHASNFGGDPDPVLAEANAMQAVQLVERVTQAGAEDVVALAVVPPASARGLGDVGAGDGLDAVWNAGSL